MSPGLAFTMPPGSSREVICFLCATALSRLKQNEVGVSLSFSRRKQDLTIVPFTLCYMKELNANLLSCSRWTLVGSESPCKSSSKLFLLALIYRTVALISAVEWEVYCWQKTWIYALHIYHSFKELKCTC